MNNSVFPYKPQKVSINAIKTVKNQDKGTEGNIDKCGWLTDGPLRPIEEGLPLYDKDNSKITNNITPKKDYLKSFSKIYKNLLDIYPEYIENEFNNGLLGQYSIFNNNDIKKSTLSTKTTQRNINDHLNKNNKSSNQTSIDHIYTWGDSQYNFDNENFDDDINYLENKNEKKIINETGIVSLRNNEKNKDQSSNIRELHFKSLSPEEIHLEQETSNPIKPLNLDEIIKTNNNKNIYKIPIIKKDPISQECLKKYFNPKTNQPFVPENPGDDFPLELLNPEPGSSSSFRRSLSTLSELSINSTSNQNTIFSNFNELNHSNEIKQTLLDTSQQDILFTNQKVPFTRKDIAELKAFHNHWNISKIKDKERIEEKFKNKKKIVKETYHSKVAFSKYLDLIDEECQRIQSGIIGKSRFKKKSMWEEALKFSKNDKSSLRSRREFWWRLTTYVRFMGGVKDSFEKILILTFREKLMYLSLVDKNLFWNVLKEVPNDVLENITALKLIEFIRIVLGVDQVEFGHFLDQNNISRQIYTQTILNSLSREHIEKMNEIAKNPIIVPDCD